MRTVLWASVRVYARRYVATIVAIVIGTGFVVATGTLSGSLRAGLLGDLGVQYARSETVVTGVESPAAAQRLARELPGVTGVDAYTTASLSAGGHRREHSLAVGVQLGTVSVAPRLRWQSLVAGQAPTRPGQVLLDAGFARRHHLVPGDLLRVSGPGWRPTPLVVSGTTPSSTGPLAAVAYLTWSQLRMRSSAVAVSDVVTTAPSSRVPPASLRRSEVAEPSSTFVQSQMAQATRGVDLVAALLLLFAAIAYVVSALVIANTFSVLLAQRTREFALLRCVGASAAQVRRGVLVEACLVGTGAATAGVLLGWLTGVLLTQVGRAQLPDVPLGSPSLAPSWVLGGWVVGVLVTFGASLLPAIRGTRVSPLAALQPRGSLDVRTRSGLLRILLGSAMVSLGLFVLLAGGLSSLGPVLVAGAVSFLGVLLLGPVLVPRLVRLLGLPVRLFGVPGRLAASNAVRNPHRTAATAGSLLIGVTLLSGLAVGIDSIGVTVAKEIVRSQPVDASLNATHGALPPSTLGKVSGVSGVTAVEALRGPLARLSGPGMSRLDLPIVGMGGHQLSLTRAPAALRPPRGVLLVPWETFYSAGSPRRVQVQVGAQRLTLRVRAADGLVGIGLAPVGTVRALAPGTQPLRAVWARSDLGADQAALAAALTRIAEPAGASLAGGVGDRVQARQILRVMALTVVALVSIGVAIAVVGIGSTLGLSVLERTREHAVLRALGLTRLQLRSMLAVEGLLLAGAAGVLGAVLGSCYAVVALQAVVGDAVSTVSVALPFGQLALIVLGAAGLGLLASVIPARAAARLAPVAALNAD